MNINSRFHTIGLYYDQDQYYYKYYVKWNLNWISFQKTSKTGAATAAT